MSDGHFNVCKSCIKKAARENYKEKSQDPEWMANERARAREKIKRLNYAKKYKAKTNEQKKRLQKYKDEYAKRNPQKRKAHFIVSNAIRDKKLFKQPCAVCGKKEVEAHHNDYSNPLDVIWLCQKHHKQVHWKD